mgnify:FL=1|jgi:hypothetical protein
MLNKAGSDFYAIMREPQKGDLVLHFYEHTWPDGVHENRFSGFSRVKTKCVATDDQPPINSSWGYSNQYYRIDLDLKLVSIKKQKNGHQQTIPLCRKAAEVLMGLQSGHGNEFVFHSPRVDHYSRSAKRFSERSSQVFRYYRRMVGLPEMICFHSLRHGFCTALANAGKSSFVIKAAARYQDISTTLR